MKTIWTPPRTHTKLWGMSGEGWLFERRILGVWFFERITTQKWSPLMHEYQRVRGVRFGCREFATTKTVCRFFDGKKPEITKGAH